LWLTNLKKRDHLQDIGVNGRMILTGCEMWNVFIRLRVGTSGSVLWENNETSGSVEYGVFLSTGESLSACPEGPCFMDLIM